jgi:preprotein translocase subunit SecE
VARETRRQRRDARRAAGDAGPATSSGGTLAARARGLAPRPAAEAAAPVLRRERRGAVAGSIGFVAESWAELKKVDWPGRPQVIQGTVIVLIACLIVGIFLYGADQAIRPLVRQLLLGQ